MDSSTGMGYWQNQTQHSKTKVGNENRFSVQGFDSALMTLKVAEMWAVTAAVSYGMGIWVLGFLQLSMQFTGNWDPA